MVPLSCPPSGLQLKAEFLRCDDNPVGASSFPVSFPSTSAITSFASRCTGPRDFARFELASLCRQDLLCFFKVDPPYSQIAPLSALINGSSWPSVIGDRPSHPICLRQRPDYFRVVRHPGPVPVPCGDLRSRPVRIFCFRVQHNRQGCDAIGFRVAIHQKTFAFAQGVRSVRSLQCRVISRPSKKVMSTLVS